MLDEGECCSGMLPVNNLDGSSLVFISKHVPTIRIHIQTVRCGRINMHRLEIPSGLMSVLDRNRFSGFTAWPPEHAEGGLFSGITLCSLFSLCKAMHGHVP